MPAPLPTTQKTPPPLPKNREGAPANRQEGRENPAERRPGPPKRRKQEQETKDNISNIEWGLLIGAAMLLDFVIQPGLDLITLFTLGVILNRFLDIGVAFGLFIYCHLRGLTNVKQIISLIATFGLEVLGPGDFLPLWVADITLIMVWHKIELKLKKVPLPGTAEGESAKRILKKLPFLKEAAPQPEASHTLPKASQKEPEKGIQSAPEEKLSSGNPENAASTVGKEGNVANSIPEDSTSIMPRNPNNTIDLRNSGNGNRRNEWQDNQDRLKMQRQERMGIRNKGEYKKNPDGSLALDRTRQPIYEHGRLKSDGRDTTHDRAYENNRPFDPRNN